MKKFRFSLDAVLEYKRQVLDWLESEYQALTAKVRHQETVVAAAECCYAQTNEDYREKKSQGMLVAEAMAYEMGLHRLEEEISQEMETLESFKRLTEEKHSEMVRAKQDISSIEMVRDKKLEVYQAELQKDWERFIDDLMCARAAGRKRGGGSI